jgi:hypothetical protein
VAPRIFTSLTIYSLLLATILTAIPAPASAASSVPPQTTIREHVFKFYLDPSLTPDVVFAQTNLPKYIADMNAILAKNTNRRLVFNPETDIVLTQVPPQSNHTSSPLPEEGFEIWAHAELTAYPVSYGGNASIDSSGAGVLAGLKWTRLYDPDRLASRDVPDYWTQINNMLHELAHVFGAGAGEYYNLSTIRDMTGISPLQDINISDPDDPFWSDKADFLADPLLRNAAQTGGLELSSDRSGLLDYVKFSDLTATIMNRSYRNSLPMADLDLLTVRVLANGGTPVIGANVKIWSVIGAAPYQSRLITDVSTDAEGEAVFSWGSSTNPHNNYDFLRLIKTFRDGYAASAQYVSIFDVDRQKLNNGSDHFTVTIQLEESPVSLQPVPTFQDVPANNFAWSSIEQLYNSGITTGCSQSPKLYCPESSITRGSMAVFLLRAMYGASHVPDPIQTGIIADLPSAGKEWMQPWIEEFYEEGISTGCGAAPLRYCPDGLVTRGSMAVFLLRAKYGPSYTPPPASNPPLFADVPADGKEWMQPWIEAFYNEGITTGCGTAPLRYCPESPVSRAAMAVFINRTFAISIP